MNYKGREITLTADGNYRPDTVIVDGELYSMTLFAKKHGWNWQSRAAGNQLFYRSESGHEWDVPQKVLMNTFAPKLRALIKETGLSQRAFAEAVGVPARTIEDWVTFQRKPSRYAEDNLIEQFRKATLNK